MSFRFHQQWASLKHDPIGEDMDAALSTTDLVLSTSVRRRRPRRVAQLGDDATLPPLGADRSNLLSGGGMSYGSSADAADVSHTSSHHGATSSREPSLRGPGPGPRRPAGFALAPSWAPCEEAPKSHLPPPAAKPAQGRLAQRPHPLRVRRSFLSEGAHWA